MAFVILSYPRSGTHMVRTALNSHPGLLCHDEIFNPDILPLEHIVASGAAKLYAEHTSGKYGCNEGFLVHGYTPIETHPTGDQLSALWGLLQQVKPTLIALDRRDQLRRCFSNYQARKAKCWHVRIGKPTKKLATPKVDPSQVEWQMQAVTASREQRDRLFPGIPVFFYEDLVADWVENIAKIQQLLGVEVRDLTPTTLKQDPRPIHEMVSNYRELRKYFTGTPFEYLFTEAEQADKEQGLCNQPM